MRTGPRQARPHTNSVVVAETLAAAAAAKLCQHDALSAGNEKKFCHNELLDLHNSKL